MAACCRTDESPPTPCPGCGRPGPAVGPAPVRPHHQGASEGPWRHCATVGCPVVFHLDGATVTDTQLAARVGSKGASAPEPVCFCFGHTPAGIAADIALNGGVGTITASIRAAVAGGQCACEHLNPSGSCCLPAVRRTVVSLRTAGGPFPAAAPGTPAGGSR